MILTQAKVVGDARAIAILTGRVTEIVHDRRETPGPIRIGDAARRRKLPDDLEPLIGTGRLWVAFGHFEVRAKDIENWGKSSEMFIVASDLSFRITKLTPREPEGGPTRRIIDSKPEIVSWKFAALVQPNEQQLERIQAEIVNQGYYG
jgi:hypothetical protein